MLELDGVSLHFNKANGEILEILSGANLSISQGDRWAVIGPSGCGKTTLLHLLAGLRQPTEGAVKYNGHPMVTPQDDISIILQEYGLFPWKTVKENIALPLRLKGTKKEVIKKQTQDILNQLGLGGQEDKYPSRLSGGQRQRVAIGRALINNPSVLLMDEPFSALDALTRERLQELVLDLCQDRGLTLVLVTHSIEEAIFLGKKILVFSNTPGKWAMVVDNPNSGLKEYRESDDFYRQCNYLRELIGGVSHE